MATSMKYNLLGQTGLKVSEICCGTMTFGQGTTEPEAHEILDTFVAGGGNFIDTADVYTGGTSEKVLGSWLVKQKKRDGLVIATKVYFGGPGPNDMGLSRVHIIKTVDQSLDRLQTPYIDLLQIHSWDSQTPVVEWMRTMKDLVTVGKVRYVGVCNVTGWQLQKIVTVAKELQVPLASLQTQYNLLCRAPEYELLDCSIHNRLGYLCWSPLKGGWLTGKFKKDAAPAADSRVGQVEAGKVAKLQSNPSYSQYKDDENVWALLATMKTIAEAHKSNEAQVALRWLLQRTGVTSVIIGARTLAQLKDNLGASTFILTEAEMVQLNEKSAGPIPYPYEMVWRTSARGGARLDDNLFPITQN